MIRKPTPDEEYQLKQHLGLTAFRYFLEAIDAINAHFANSDRRIPGTVEVSDAGESAQESGEIERFSRTELGE